MITNFKIFENICILPKIGDYVIIIKNKFVTLIGKSDNYRIFQIEKIKFYKYNLEHGGEALEYHININGFRRIISIHDFECWSNNKEELEMYIDAKKYNI